MIGLALGGPPPGLTFFGKASKPANQGAISQQPTATIAGKISFCGPETAGEKKRRLASVAFVPFAFALLTGIADTLRVLEALAIRDCVVLALAGAFLRFCAFGITHTHFSGVDLPGAVSPGSVTFSWFAAS